MKGTIDLTKGRPAGLILRFFFPLLLTNTLQQLYSFADTAIVGKGLGDDSLAAVGNMSSLCFLIVGFSIGLSNGFSILIAQSFGEKDYKKLRRTLAASVRLAVIITATIISQVFSGSFCFIKLRRIEFLRHSRNDFRNDPEMNMLLLGNGIPMACMNSITAVGCMVVQYFVNGLGIAFTSAYSACSKYLNMAMQLAATEGAAMSSYTSQNYGAKRFDRIKEGLKVCLLISAAAYILLDSVMTFFPCQLAGMILNGEEQISYAAEFLPMCGIMIFSVDMLFVIRNGVQGMGFPLLKKLLY